MFHKNKILEDPQVYIETTRCKASPENTAWSWAVSCSARRTLLEQFSGTENSEGTLLLNILLETFNSV